MCLTCEQTSMSPAQIERERLDVSAENIDEIDHTDVTFQSGVTVLAGCSATNRTSLLQALMGVLGSETVSLKGDAEEGHIELTVGDEIDTRTSTRRNGTVVTSGEPYLTDDEVDPADLSAFLFESNDARRAVARGIDLRKRIMRLVDTEPIQAEIDRLDSLADRLPELEERRITLD